MKKLFFTFITFFTFSFSFAQYQLRPIMIQVQPLNYQLGFIGTSNQPHLGEKNGNYTFQSAGSSFALYVPVIKNLYIGLSVNPLNYWAEIATNESTNENYFGGDTSTGYIENHYENVKAFTWGAGLLYMPGSKDKFLNPYFKLNYSRNTQKYSGHKTNVSGYYYDPLASIGYQLSKDIITNESRKFTTNGFSFGMGLELRINRYIRFNPLDLTFGIYKGTDCKFLSLQYKSGLTIMLLKQK
jgi:hypothetical protein